MRAISLLRFNRKAPTMRCNSCGTPPLIYIVMLLNRHRSTERTSLITDTGSAKEEREREKIRISRKDNVTEKYNVIAWHSTSNVFHPTSVTSPQNISIDLRGIRYCTLCPTDTTHPPSSNTVSCHSPSEIVI